MDMEGLGMPGRFQRSLERQSAIVQLLDTPTDNRLRLIEEYQRRSEAAFAPETLRNYRQIVRHFRGWCALEGYSCELPIAPQTVAAYVDFLGGKLRASTIATRLWAISEMHLAGFHASPCRHRLVELALKGVKRKYGAAIRQAPPLGKRDVLEVIARLGDSRIEMRDKAVLWVASDT